jgi:RNA polymerase sigma-70 factor (ECF subfamily)
MNFPRRSNRLRPEDRAVNGSASVGFAADVRRAATDIELVERFRAGDEAAFEAIFRRYQTPVFNVVHRMVRGESAYDLTQDVFLKAYRSIRGFRGDSKLSTWLFTIARHTCLNHLRHHKVIEEESLGWGDDDSERDLLDDSPPVEHFVEVRALQDAVDHVLSTLPPGARLMLILRDFEQLSYEEISGVTELSIANVKSRIHRARQLFRKRFEPWMEWIEGSEVR